jgi:hypothetical protein
MDNNTSANLLENGNELPIVLPVYLRKIDVFEIAFLYMSATF